LNGTLAGAESQGKSRARPGFTVGKKAHHGGVLIFDRPRQQDHVARSAWLHRKAPLRCGDIGQRSHGPAKAADFDSQACAMRFIDEPRPESSGEEHVPRYISRPGFG
jgi:hypothetical protein